MLKKRAEMQDDPPPPPFTAELAATIKAADAALAQHRHPPLAMAKERERGGGIQEKGKIDFQKAKAGTEWLKTLADTVLQDKKEASEESKTHPDAITQDKKEASEKKAPATHQAVLPEEPHWTTFCARRVLLPLQLVLYPITCGEPSTCQPPTTNHISSIYNFTIPHEVPSIKHTNWDKHTQLHGLQRLGLLAFRLGLSPLFCST